MSGGSKKQVEKGPPINAQSKDEENFIQYVHTYKKACVQPWIRGELTDGLQRVFEKCGC